VSFADVASTRAFLWIIPQLLFPGLASTRADVLFKKSMIFLLTAAVDISLAVAMFQLLSYKQFTAAG
jgi:hypothetical protein